MPNRAIAPSYVPYLVVKRCYILSLSVLLIPHATYCATGVYPGQLSAHAVTLQCGNSVQDVVPESTFTVINYRRSAKEARLSQPS